MNIGAIIGFIVVAIIGLCFLKMVYDLIKSQLR